MYISWLYQPKPRTCRIKKGVICLFALTQLWCVRHDSLRQICKVQLWWAALSVCFIAPFIQALGSSIMPCLVLTKVAFASFWSVILTKCCWSPTTFTCAFTPGCPMSHIWLPSTDCKFHSLIDWLIDWLIGWWIDELIDWLISSNCSAYCPSDWSHAGDHWHKSCTLCN